jgi:hypothetical protein
MMHSLFLGLSALRFYFTDPESLDAYAIAHYTHPLEAVASFTIT